MVIESENIVYTNSTYGFTLTFPQTWKEYITKNRVLDWGTSGTSDSIDFGFSFLDSIFNVSVHSKSQWQKIVSTEDSKPIYLGENSQYIFGYTRAKDQTSDNYDYSIAIRMLDVKDIVKTFIATADESESAKNTLIAFFDYLSKNEFEAAANLFSLDPQFTPLEEFATGNNQAEVLKNYCQAVGTCLKTNVLSVKKATNDEYHLVVEFVNKDDSIYVFGPCCGATEEEMPSKNKFDFTVKLYPHI
jgi:hypothetical protein